MTCHLFIPKPCLDCISSKSCKHAPSMQALPPPHTHTCLPFNLSEDFDNNSNSNNFYVVRTSSDALMLLGESVHTHTHTPTCTVCFLHTVEESKCCCDREHHDVIGTSSRVGLNPAQRDRKLFFSPHPVPTASVAAKKTQTD